MEEIRRCLAKGPQRLGDVIRACKGAYPKAVVDLLEGIKPEITNTLAPCLKMPGFEHATAPVLELFVQLAREPHAKREFLET